MFEDRTTANIQKEALEELSPTTGISAMAGSFADATTFNLDEYRGLDPQHEQSYRYFMQKHLFDQIGKRRHLRLRGSDTAKRQTCRPICQMPPNHYLPAFKDLPKKSKNSASGERTIEVVSLLPKALS